MVIKSFFDQGTEDIYNRVRSKEARRSCPEQIRRVAQRKLDQLNEHTNQRPVSAMFLVDR